MPLPPAYARARATTLQGVLKPAYGTFAPAGVLPPAYGSDGTIILADDFLYSGITYTQSGNLTYIDSTGTLQTAAVDTMVKDYDPSTLTLRGYPFWEARTNSLRNNTMVGASTGTPGTDPTNWISSAVSGSITGKSIVAIGTENGIAYIDYRFTFSGATSAAVQLEASNQIVAAISDNWTSSVYVKLVGGSLTNMQMQLATAEATAAGAFLAGTTANFTPTSSGLATQRIISTRTLNQATVARVYNAIFFVASGAADVTIRIGLPQLELGAFATPVIKTSASAVTRAAPSAIISSTNFSSFYNQTEGTIVYRAMLSEISGYGAIATINDATTNNQMLLDKNGATPRDIVTVGGAGQATIIMGAVSANTQYGFAATYKLNDYAVSLNGGAVTADTSATVPTVTRIQIGSDIGASRVNGWIYSLSHYPARLPNASLQALST